ncbi:hypothetical protein B0H19DRAFT_1055122 [Mycena capillaripes]|nr:hypothetical protein B0H19DRAFT_1055122 [Mycena capillaripes]
MVIGTLTLQQYHGICYLNLRRARTVTISTPIAVNRGIEANLGTVVSWPSTNRLEDSIEVVSSPNGEVAVGHWIPPWGSRREKTEEGWTRLISRDVFDSSVQLRCWVRSRNSWLGWLSQANHIFSRLQITSNFEDYGVERLSFEDAARLGFPSIQLNTELYGHYWDANIYAGLRKFHRAKGFDPESQELALYLRHPLLHISRDFNPLFAHEIELALWKESVQGCMNPMFASCNLRSRAVGVVIQHHHWIVYRRSNFNLLVGTSHACRSMNEVWMLCEFAVIANNVEDALMPKSLHGVAVEPPHAHRNPFAMICKSIEVDRNLELPSMRSGCGPETEIMMAGRGPRWMVVSAWNQLEACCHPAAQRRYPPDIGISPPDECLFLQKIIVKKPLCEKASPCEIDFGATESLSRSSGVEYRPRYI